MKAAATLAGTIKVTTSNFKSKKGQSFQVMRYHSLTGSFARRPAGPSFSVSYSRSVHVKY